MKQTLLAMFLVSFALSLQAATTIDLTTAGANNGTGSTAAIGGNFVVQQISPQSTGTGVIDSFLRIQSNTTEQGYNTSNGTPYDDKSGNFTRALSLSEVPTVNLTCTASGCTQVASGGTAYRQFLLDINQSNPSLIDLNQIQIFQSNGDPSCGSPASTCGTTVSGTYPTLSGLTGGSPAPQLVFQMSGTTTIKMDYALNAGSGSGDMFLYVPNSDFSSSFTNVVLFSQFGTPPGVNATNDGFEEWAVLKAAGTTCVGDCTTNVPEPGSVVLLGTILLGISGMLRRRFAV